MGKRKAEDQKQRDGIMRKIQSATASFEDGGRGRKPRNAGSFEI